MRTLHVVVLAAVTGVIAATGACNWTEFDGLADETWVHSTKKPDVSSSDYGVAIQRAAQGASAAAGRGGRLVVLGTGAPTYSELVYDASGESSFPPTAQRLQEQITSLGVQPILLGVPGKDEVSAVVPATGATAILTGGAGNLSPYQIFDATPPTAATYMAAPGGLGQLPLVAIGDTVYGARIAAVAPNPHPKCQLADSAAPGAALVINALGAVPGGDGDDVLAWAASGKLFRYPSSVFNACATPTQAAGTAIQLSGAAFLPEAGAQILTIDPMAPNFVLLQGHNGDNGMLQVVNATTMAVVGPAVSVPRLRTAAILTAGSKRYVIAGAPGMPVDGKSSGQVTLYEVSTATGVNAMAAATLHDAQPEDTQSFGRAVAAMPFNGREVIAIGADNEIFVYFRAKLANGEFLYDETRQ
jgi:hypothetical protein